MKKYLIIGILLICLISNASAYEIYTLREATAKQSYDFNGNGLAEYPNAGYISAYTSMHTPLALPPVNRYGSNGISQTYFYDTDGNTVNYTFFGQSKSNNGICGGDSWTSMIVQSSASDVYYAGTEDSGSATLYAEADWESETNTNLRIKSQSTTTYTLCDKYRYASSSCYLVISYTELYNISGITECLDQVELIYNDSVIAVQSFNDTVKTYNFGGLIEGFDYKLNFSDSHIYEFTCETSDIEYDHDDCSHTQYRFEESCDNLIPDSEGLYIENEGVIVLAITNFYEPSGILDISNSSANHIYIYSNTFIGRTCWLIDPVVSDTTYTLENPNIAWGLKVIVQNESDGTLIDGAMVKVDQDCYCTSGYSTRQKTTINGMVGFGDMSLQDASLFVMKSGYKICNENTTGYSAFLSGRANFSSKTWVVKLAPSWSENVSTFYEVNYSTGIHFKDVNGNRTSQILDTDTEVYLYYENNNSEEEAMTLKFQSSHDHSYFIDEDSWSIAYDDIGHKTIPQAHFTPWTYAYRAVMYNSSIYGWNLTIPLTVRNQTKEETLHYENLTTNLWFMHEADGKIDYREDMQIVSHARSNNTTLMNIDLEVWKDGAMLCYKNLTESDYAGASYPYYYVYEPVYDYVPGSNYTTKMYGFDRTLLEVRYLECINDTITRKNKLTIGVKDRTGANLDNCYIYLEGWGSLATGTNYYNSYEGIDNGYYRYKAAKSGYSGDGWAEVTLSDDDEIVWYTLTEDYTNASATQQKLTDDDVKAMFFPLMFFLLICIIFGGFKYVGQ